MTPSRSPFNGFTIQGDSLNNLDHSFSSAGAADKLFAFHCWGHSLVTHIRDFFGRPQHVRRCLGFCRDFFVVVVDWVKLCEVETSKQLIWGAGFVQKSVCQISVSIWWFCRGLWKVNATEDIKCYLNVLKATLLLLFDLI